MALVQRIFHRDVLLNPLTYFRMTILALVCTDRFHSLSEPNPSLYIHSILFFNFIDLYSPIKFYGNKVQTIYSVLTRREYEQELKQSKGQKKKTEPDAIVGTP